LYGTARIDNEAAVYIRLVLTEYRALDHDARSVARSGITQSRGRSRHIAVAKHQGLFYRFPGIGVVRVVGIRNVRIGISDTAVVGITRRRIVLGAAAGQRERYQKGQGPQGNLREGTPIACPIGRLRDERSTSGTVEVDTVKMTGYHLDAVKKE
jgi:hypothetical protein